MKGDANVTITAASAAVAVLGVFATGQIVAGDDMIWAAEVTHYTENVQNYGVYDNPEKMTDDTTWWLTGPPDADQDDNGYAWDFGVDEDYVAGWRSFGTEQFTVRFDQAIADVDGNDIMLYTYGGPNGISSVWASPTDNDDDYVQIGEVGAGTPGYLVELWYDFAGMVDDVQYIKVMREAGGPQSGRFFDAIGGMFSGTPCPADVNQDGTVDIDDLFAVLGAWGTCDGCPEDVNDDDLVNIDDVFEVLGAWGDCP